MARYAKVPEKGDPSSVNQIFSGYNVQLLCCRYWWLKHWESKNLSFPYWRVYWNANSGGHLAFNGKIYDLTPDKVFVISPNTPFSTFIQKPSKKQTEYRLEGGRISLSTNEEVLKEKGYILHLFTHFNIGMPYDYVKPNIFVFSVNPYLEHKLKEITRYLTRENEKFNFYSSLLIHSIISDLLTMVPKEQWNIISADNRILNILLYIEHNLSGSLSNDVLADKSNLATNAFTRLFRDETGISPQKFVKKIRIDRACMLLHHADMTIDEIASLTGFADRYHFSRIFKQITGYSPGSFRKSFKFGSF
jgi:AraC-like DNA-binding protein